MQSSVMPLWTAGKGDDLVDCRLQSPSLASPLYEDYGMDASNLHSISPLPYQWPLSPVSSLPSTFSCSPVVFFDRSSPSDSAYETPSQLLDQWNGWGGGEGTDRPAVEPPASASASAWPLPVQSPAAASGASAPSMSRKARVCESACVPCRRAKTGCDGQRPCSRCVSRRRGGDCVDRSAEDIQRGRINRKRKPKVQPLHSANPPTTPQPRQPPAALSAQSPPSAPSDASAAARQALSATRAYSSLVCLAAVQAAGQREPLVRLVEQLTGVDAQLRTKTLRSIQIGLAHLADQLDVADFSAFLEGRPGPPLPPHIAAFLPLSNHHPQPHSPSPSAPSPSSRPLPAILQRWLRPHTRPMHLDWSATPATRLTASSNEEDADANVAIVRIEFLPSARTNLNAWESRTEANGGSNAWEETEVPKTTQCQPSSASLDELLRCLSLDASPAEGEATSGGEDGPSVPRSHATWCSARWAPAEGGEVSVEPAGECSCHNSLALPCVMLVNEAWERLFGWSQAEVRREALRRGSRTQADWFRVDAWYAFHFLIASQARSRSPASGDGLLDLRSFVVCRTKSGTELSCMLHKSVAMVDGVSRASTSFVPIALNPLPPPQAS